MGRADQKREEEEQGRAAGCHGPGATTSDQRPGVALAGGVVTGPTLSSAH